MTMSCFPAIAGEGVTPVWFKDEMPLLREEEGGIWMVFPPKKPRPHFLNETAVFVLKRCNGKTDVQGIVFQLATEYPNVPFSRVEVDTINCLYFLKTLGLIRWDGQKYVKDNMVSSNMHQGIHFKMAGEGDFGRLAIFLQQYFKDISEGKAKGSFHLMTPADIQRGNYDDIAIRTRQFHLVENFFCLDKAHELQGVSSLGMASGSQGVVSFVALAVRDFDQSEKTYKDLINKTLFYLKHHKVFRVKIPLIPSSIDDQVEEFLKELGFSHEATLLDELGKGQDLALWSVKID